MQNYQALVSGVTTFGQLYGLLNNNMDALRSQFAGIQFPENPTVGQPCYRTDMTPPRMYQYDGNGWTDFAAASPGVAALIAEVTLARGIAASLNARLSVALNPDGTLKGDAPASDWWNEEPDDIARVSDTAFSVSGDKRQIYTPRRALLIAFDGGATLSTWVQGAAYDADADRTQVTVSQGPIGTTPLAVEFGQPVGNEPRISVASYTETGLTRAIKDSEAQAGALDPDLFDLPYITLSALDILVRKAVIAQLVGRIDLVPYRITELPPGWYFCNGDLYPLASDQGKALSAFSAAYKADWGIAVSGQSISIPNMFHVDGRGFYLRAANGTTRQVGIVELDALQNIKASTSTSQSMGPMASNAVQTGAFGLGPRQGTAIPWPPSTSAGQSFLLMFDASQDVRTATETRGLSKGMTPAICLGV